MKIKMENCQIIGEELLKGGQYFEKIFKKEVVLVLEMSFGLNDQNHTIFQPIHN